MSNQKISELTANTSPLDTDLLALVDDPAGTPLTQKITVAYLRQAWAAFSQSATVTVADTVTETTLIGAGLGSATLIAAFFNAAGRALEWDAWGVLSNTGTPTLNLQLKVGSTVLAQTGAITLAADQTNVQWHLHGKTVCRSTGATGTLWTHGVLRVGSAFYPLSNTAASGAIDLTAVLVANVTATWGTAAAGNSISAHLLDLLKAN